MKKSTRLALSRRSGGRKRKKKSGAGLMPSHSVSALLKWPDGCRGGVGCGRERALGERGGRSSHGCSPPTLLHASTRHCRLHSSSLLRSAPPPPPPPPPRPPGRRTQVEDARDGGERGAREQRPDRGELRVQNSRGEHSDADEQQGVLAGGSRGFVCVCGGGGSAVEVNRACRGAGPHAATRPEAPLQWLFRPRPRTAPPSGTGHQLNSSAGTGARGLAGRCNARAPHGGALPRTPPRRARCRAPRPPAAPAAAHPGCRRGARTSRCGRRTRRRARASTAPPLTQSSRLGASRGARRAAGAPAERAAGGAGRRGRTGSVTRNPCGSWAPARGRGGASAR
jgi:hypothetical protein